MAWLDRRITPLYHTTSNHTTYDRTVRPVLEMLPQSTARNVPTRPAPGLS